jgi:hypothetical protein
MSLLQSKKDLSRNIKVNGRDMYVDRSTGCRNFSGPHQIVSISRTTTTTLQIIIDGALRDKRRCYEGMEAEREVARSKRSLLQL